MKQLVITILAATIAACGQSSGPTEPSAPPAVEDTRPNIVMVLVDDLRWDELGIAGHSYVETPNIDRIAREGAYFSRAFTTTPLCSPARATFLTGLYPHTHGITDNLARNEQSHQLETYPKMLQAEGYDTAFIGKWHMGNDDTPRPGFSTWAGMKGQGEAINPEFNLDGERRQIDGYVTDILTDLSVDFVNTDRQSPFLLYVSHKALHPNITQLDDGSSVASPSGVPGFIAADRHKGRYASEVVARRPNSGVVPADRPALMRQIGDLPRLGPATITPEQTIHDRQEMLLAVDESLGTIMSAIDTLGELDNTVVVVASDHGYWYGEHGLSAERRLAYEEALRIPLMMRFPKRIPAGIRPGQMALSIDVAPTMLELAGAVPPDNLHGMSLVPILEGENPDWRSSFLIEYYSDTVFERINHMGYKAVRTNRYKYIRYEDLEGMDELYDLAGDPYELRNVINDPRYANVLTALQAELNRLLEETS
ncbi:MAG: sulfatase [Gammaproteobacteria bacterium]|nr:sulfatase [Gammaproteobacteria bacterium]